MQKRYKLIKRNQERNNDLDKKYGTLIADIITSRGIKNLEEAYVYFNPKEHLNLGDPFLIHDMEKAIDRIYKAVHAHEKITVQSDYDCDGIPGAAVLTNLFNKIGFTNFVVSIPDRNQEGYGMSTDYVKKIKENGSTLIITIDLGIAEVESVKLAKEYNIDTIITDHHTIGEKIPDAFAIVHPKMEKSSYENTELCGCGVIYTLVRGFVKKYGNEFNIPLHWDKTLLDYVALSTLSDMMTLNKENKSIVDYGIHLIKHNPRPGIKALALAAHVFLKNVTQDDISFMLIPKLNVASRMGTPHDAYKLLISTDEKEAKENAENLVKLNNERRSLVAQMVKEAKRDIVQKGKTENDIIVVGDSAWRVGLLGLVATKLVEAYNKPVFVWARIEKDAGKIAYKGSCRGNGTINIHSFMEFVGDDIFSEFGGHFDAGGFGIVPNKIYTINEDLNKKYIKYKEKNAHIQIEETFNFIDAVLPLSLISTKLHKTILSCGPFGPGNTEPVFSLTKLTLQDVRVFGKEKSHLEILFTDQKGIAGSAYTFYKSIDDFNVKTGDEFHLITTLDHKLQNGSVRLRIKDIRRSNM